MRLFTISSLVFKFVSEYGWFEFFSFNGWFWQRFHGFTILLVGKITPHTERKVEIPASADIAINPRTNAAVPWPRSASQVIFSAGKCARTANVVPARHCRLSCTNSPIAVASVNGSPRLLGSIKLSQAESGK